MKKLIVLALSAMMILSLAAVSMAAVTVSGETNFGMNLRTATDANKTTMYDFGDAKIGATATINDQVTAFAAFKGESKNLYVPFVDEAWVKLNEGFGSVKVGYYGWNGKEKLDILAPVADLKNNAGMNLIANVAENVTLDVYAAQPQDKNAAGADNSGGFLYGAKVKYATDAFGAAVAISKNAFDTQTENAIQLNGWYNLGDFCVFMDYNPEWKDQGTKKSSAILGATYDSANSPVYARLEYDASPETGSDNAYGFRVGYKLNGAKIEYQTVKDWVKDSKATSYIKLNCAF